tara:strand:+ start:840 stop:1097 length:258 start_codon:yes stop_codon:yes gene_type:complete
MTERKELLEIFSIWIKPNFLSNEALIAQCADEAIRFVKSDRKKQLILSGVSHQREQLEGFVDWFNTNDKTQAILSERIEEYLKTL